MRPDDPRTAGAIVRFLAAVLDVVGDRVALVKPQSAFFEQLGWRGFRALETVVRQAQARGLLVLLDAKRGDVGSTAEAYAAAYLGPQAAVPADALTVNPYLGSDALAPFLARAQAHGRGLFVLTKTSNPGARDFQDQVLAQPGRPTLAMAVARTLLAPAESLRGPQTGWSLLGVVVGATYPEDARRLRERLPSSLFLIPGYGAQGGTAADAVAGLVRGPAGREGGVINASRSILFPTPAATTPKRWEGAVRAAFDRTLDELSAALAVPEA